MSTRRGVFWPLLLIALGLIFLLQNFGVISGVSWLAVASLWPLLLILIGLDIAFARRWPLPTLAVEIAVIAAGLDPRIGFMHTDSEGRSALVLDLMEPMRPVRFVLVLGAIPSW